MSNYARNISQPEADYDKRNSKEPLDDGVNLKLRPEAAGVTEVKVPFEDVLRSNDVQPWFDLGSICCTIAPRGFFPDRDDSSTIEDIGRHFRAESRVFS
jgi:hypothetical protein